MRAPVPANDVFCPHIGHFSSFARRDHSRERQRARQLTLLTALAAHPKPSPRGMT